MSEHLALPFYRGTFERRKPKGGGGFQPREDTKQFSEVQVFKLTKMKDDFKKDKEKLKQFFDPNLIFKVELQQKISEENFIRFLERNGIKVISPSPAGKGYWVLLAEDEDLSELTRRLGEYGERERYKEFHAIESFDPIPREEKIGKQLKETPLQEGQETYLDIEIWRMENKKLESFLQGFKELIASKDGEITDSITTENLCLIRVRITKQVFEEIIEFREINRIDRPPKPYITFNMLSVPYEELTVEEPPSKDATAIAVLDSGILSNHPLLEKAVGDEKAFTLLNSDKIFPDKPSDDVGHGTKVAGVALYGDIKKCIDEKSFIPEIWILSAKVMFAEENPVTGEIEASYDESELLEHQLERAIRWVVENYENCKVVNISFGDRYKKMFGNKRQFSLATLIDDIAKELGLVFVISAGNITQDTLSANFLDTYPDYLLEEKEAVKIIDPASSAYALTVGSITQEFGPSNRNPFETLFSPAQTNYPSPFTCTGPGYKAMIKPELVEEGGNIIYSSSDPSKMPDIGGKLIVLNPDWLKDGKLFTVDYGTSYSTPRVAHYLGKLFNSFPVYSPNMIKTVLIASAEIPLDRPGVLSEINFNSSDTELMNLLKVYGYGKPNLDVALSSEFNRVLLQAENGIKLDSVHLYYFYLPSEFIETSGEKQLAVSLVYDPPIRRNRIDYMGVNMEYHLFKNSTINEIIAGYKSIQITSEIENIVPEELQIKEIDLHPGVRTRKRGIHQKGVKIYLGKPQIEPDKPMVLAVISQNRWLSDSDYSQDYAVVVSIKHQASIDLYNIIRQQIEIEERVRIRAR